MLKGKKNTWDAQFYQKNSLSQVERAKKYLASYKFSGNERVLDLGCGAGEITSEIASKAIHGDVIGIDLSKEMIAIASENHQSINNLRFLISDILDFTSKEQFDLITSFNALHWIRDHQRLLENARVSLRPKGQILFLMAYGKNEPPIDSVVLAPKWAPHLSKLHSFREFMSKINYENLLNEKNFRSIEITQIDEQHLFSSITDLASQIMTWLPNVADLSLDQCLLLSREIAESFAAHSSATNKIVYTVPMLLVRAYVD